MKKIERHIKQHNLKYKSNNYLITSLYWCTIICPCVWTFFIFPVMVAELAESIAFTSAPKGLLCNVVIHSFSHELTKSQSQYCTGSGFLSHKRSNVVWSILLSLYNISSWLFSTNLKYGTLLHYFSLNLRLYDSITRINIYKTTIVRIIFRFLLNWIF